MQARSRGIRWVDFSDLSNINKERPSEISDGLFCFGDHVLQKIYGLSAAPSGLIVVGRQLAFDFRQGFQGGLFAQFDGLVFLVETADCAEMLYLRGNHDVGFFQFLPQDCLAHDVQALVEIGEESGLGQLGRTGGNVDGDNEVGALVAGGGNGDGGGEAAVNVFLAADHGGLEDVGNADGGANRLSDVAAVEGNRIAGAETGGNGSEFAREGLDGFIVDFAVDEVLQFLAFDEAAGGQGEVDQAAFF